MKKELTQMFPKVVPFLTTAFLLLPVLAQAQISWELESQLSGITTLEGLLVAILNIIVVIAVPIIILFIIYAGFLYVTARGNADQTQQATRALTYAIIGGVIVIGAVAIAEIVKNVVDAFRA